MPPHILDILRQIACSIPHPNAVRGMNKEFLNEHYIHHLFSNKFVNFHSIDTTLSPIPDTFFSLLHPEWPTFSPSHGITNGGRYKKNGNYYDVDKNGSPGYIDFTIGNYHHPRIAIEFKLESSYSIERAAFDFLKLLDPQNQFKFSFAHFFLIRGKKLSSPNNQNRLLNAFEQSFTNAMGRCTKPVNSGLEYCFILTEISKSKRKHWQISNNSKAKVLPGYQFVRKF